MNIRKDQIRKIKALQSRLKMSDADYRLLLSDEFADTCTSLTETEADRVIATLEEKAIAAGVWNKYVKRSSRPEAPIPLKYDELGERPGFATPKQLRYVETLWKQVSTQRTDQAREHALESFIYRIANVQSMRFLTKSGVHAVIEAIKKMKEKEERRHEGHNF